MTLFLLGDKTVATQSSLFRVDPGGGSISKTAGDLAGTRRLDSPNGVKPGDAIISMCHGDPVRKIQKHNTMSFYSKLNEEKIIVIIKKGVP